MTAAPLSVPSSVTWAIGPGHRKLARHGRRRRMNAGAAPTGRRSWRAAERVGTRVPQRDQPRAADMRPHRATAGLRLSTSMPDHPTSLSVARRSRIPGSWRCS